AVTTKHLSDGVTARLGDDEADCIHNETVPYDHFFDAFTSFKYQAKVLRALRPIWAVLGNNLILGVLLSHFCDIRMKLR
ncbi:hypothetical protein, partial [Qipengyuania sp. YIM B01966]|uniref:hypothetical protein n=1 Tax=Qipengyuania sp. YIM B01966 TaxID=2778646 RepID=UPI001F450512